MLEQIKLHKYFAQPLTLALHVTLTNTFGVVMQWSAFELVNIWMGQTLFIGQHLHSLGCCQQFSSHFHSQLLGQHLRALVQLILTTSAFAHLPSSRRHLRAHFSFDRSSWHYLVVFTQPHSVTKVTLDHYYSINATHTTHTIQSAHAT